MFTVLQDDERATIDTAVGVCYNGDNRERVMRLTRTVRQAITHLEDEMGIVPSQSEHHVIVSREPYVAFARRNPLDGMWECAFPFRTIPLVDLEGLMHLLSVEISTYDEDFPWEAPVIPEFQVGDAMRIIRAAVPEILENFHLDPDGETDEEYDPEYWNEGVVDEE